MVDTVKIRQLHPARANSRKRPEAAQEPLVRGRLDHVVEDVKLALLTTGLTLEKDNQGRGQDPYNSRPVPGRDAWSERNRRR